jgi:hypothetical protein
MLKPKFKRGDIVVFTGYSDPDAAKDGVLTAGDRILLDSEADENGAFTARPMDKDGKPNQSAGSLDQVFPEEIQPTSAAATNVIKVSGFGKAKKGKAEPVAGPTDLELAPGELGETIGEIPGNLMLTDEVKQALAHEDALGAAKRLAEKQQENAFTLGGVLAVIKRDALYTAAGYEGKRAWQNYVEGELSGLNYRLVQYWITIYESFTGAGLNATHVNAMGWSKAKEIARIATIKGGPGKPSGSDILKEDRKLLLEKAKELTRDELADWVKTSYMEKGEKLLEGPRTREPFRLRLWPDQKRTLDSALAAAKRAAGTEDADVAMQLIATEWAMGHDNVEVPLEDAVRALEARYGVKIAIADAGTSKAG